MNCPRKRSELLEILSSLLQDETKAVFFSTHITSDLDKIADYVTLIDNGEIVLSAPKDDLVDNYGLVKGPRELLDGDTRKYFIGIKESEFGFEALAADKKQVRMLFRDMVVIEKPALEDIMLYCTRRKNKCTTSS